MIEKIADDLIGQMTEARLIDKEMEARYVYVFICWIEKFITVGSIIVISLMFHKLLPTIFFLVFFLELRKRTGGYHLDKFYRCYLASIVSYLVIVIISEKLSEHPQWLFAIVLLAITGIGLIGTANHPNMHMTSDELMESKKSARTIVLLEGCIILGCVLLDADMVYVSYMAIAVILCAALLCIAKIFKQEEQAGNWSKWKMFIREQSLRWDKIYILLAAVGHLVYIQSHIPSKEDLLI